MIIQVIGNRIVSDEDTLQEQSMKAEEVLTDEQIDQMWYEEYIKEMQYWQEIYDQYI